MNKVLPVHMGPRSNLDYANNVSARVVVDYADTGISLFVDYVDTPFSQISQIQSFKPPPHKRSIIL